MTERREHWGSRLGFVLAAAGSAVGVGSLWRFPYIAGQNGGGAFIILYLIFTFMLGLPVFIAELIIGRRTQKSAVLAYTQLTHKSQWKFIGWLNVLSCLIILSFYAVVSGWGVSYTLMSLTGFTDGRTPDQISGVFDTLYSSADINLLWLGLFLLINVGVVLAGVRKGIEHWSKILMPALFIMLIGLLSFSLTLDGLPQALHFIFYPDWGKVSPAMILSALGMAFFTLSVALGIILTYGSYMQSKEDVPKTAFTVACMTVFVSILASVMIFPIVFTFGYTPEAGPGLVFKTMPVLFAKLPGTLILSTIFFILFVFTALTSSISLMEMLVSNLMENFNFNRKKAVVFTALGAFILGIPSALSGSGLLFGQWKLIYGRDFFETMDFITSNWFMPIAGFLTTVFVGWVIDKQLTKAEFEAGTKLVRWYRPWFFMVRYVAPLVVAVIILQQAGIIRV
ncbi:MAG: sodium-dependent transporter [Chlamydiia bacterium]|nr:sodium-dependent transporter [Chlamydiia bacterium]